MKKSITGMWKISILFLLFTLLTACQSEEASSPAEEAVPVETKTVTSGSLEGTQSISATTEAAAEVALTPGLNANIEEIRVEKGDTVEKGQILAVLDDTDLQHALEQERAAYERAKSSVAISKAGKRRSSANADQARVALENADHSINQAEEQYEQAKINLEQAKDNQGQNSEAAERSLKTAQRSLETAKRNLETARRERDRSQQMFDAGFISQQELEEAQSAVDDAKDNVKSAEDSVADAEENLEQSKQDYEIETLKSEVARAKSALEQAKDSKKELQTNIDASEASIAEADGGIQDANAALEQARISVEQAEESLDDAVVRAPSSGKVLSVTGDPGEFYGQQEPLITLGELSSLKVTAAVTPNQLILFTAGDEMKVHFPSMDTTETGSITYIASSANENGMFPVEVQIDNTNDQLRAGIYGEFLIEETYVDHSLIVPTEALIDIEGQPSVFIAEEETAHLIPVEVIREESTVTAIDGEIEPGTAVVIRGQYFLEDGTRIEDVTEDTENSKTEKKEQQKNDAEAFSPQKQHSNAEDGGELS